MATVQGVNGPIDADELGMTLIHEHFRSSDEAITGAVAARHARTSRAPAASSRPRR